MKRANIKILALILALIVLPPLMWELKSQVGVVPGGGGVPNNAVQGASNLTTEGAIPYVSSSGTLSQDTPGIHWDATNNRLGLGTASPSVPLAFGAATGQKIELYEGGGYGFGVESNEFRFVVGSGPIFTFKKGTYGSSTQMMQIGTVGATGYTVGIGPSNTSPTGTLHVYDATATTGVTTLTVRAGAGQSSTNLANFIASNGATYAGLANNGTLFSTDYASSLSSPVFVLAAGTWNTRGFAVTSDFPILWSNSTSNSGATKDLGLARDAAGRLRVSDGSTGLGQIMIASSTPASAAATCSAGTIVWDSSYVYVCIASNTWKRAAIATW